MKKGTIFILLIIFLVFVGTRIVFAASSIGGFFGGKIISDKAMEIEIKEWAGYKCTVLGKSITIIPLGSPTGTPTSYFIPWAVVSKTRTTPTTGKSILGKYTGRTIINCVRPGNPPTYATVSLNTITLFGTSK